MEHRRAQRGEFRGDGLQQVRPIPLLDRDSDARLGRLRSYLKRNRHRRSGGHTDGYAHIHLQDPRHDPRTRRRRAPAQPGRRSAPSPAGSAAAELPASATSPSWPGGEVWPKPVAYSKIQPPGEAGCALPLAVPFGLPARACPAPELLAENKPGVAGSTIIATERRHLALKLHLHLRGPGGDCERHDGAYLAGTRVNDGGGHAVEEHCASERFLASRPKMLNSWIWALAGPRPEPKRVTTSPGDMAPVE